MRCLILLINLNNVDDSNHNDDEIEKTLAILIGLIAGVALIIVFLSFLSKVCEKHKGMVFLVHIYVCNCVFSFKYLIGHCYIN